MENPEGKRSLGRPGRRRENKIKVYLKKKRDGTMEWMDLTQDRER